ncbi:GumC family protein [Alteraurantiacibacter aquimixticola]|uniref:non-specific protein-tyrosine kinase n=1 Tax=Alteraurantiacibacter aquimixticola TaxID=2489173 RepID=A0A4T3F3C4_9SPHN|nr:polysaccharide biosynthesis tyrosine autokinase [Alteraurantiacibacter aquimixticola]TIX51251.1 polysaccharide biosynthesis tyrosine autokinase [Alteraurantiacibacter aquimixticola]
MTSMDQAITASAGPLREEKLSFSQWLPNPMHIWTVFRRHIWLFIGVVLTVLLLVAIRVLTLTPSYAATASIVLQPRSTQVINVRSVVPDLSVNSDIVDTEVRMLTSMALARRVYDVLEAQEAGRPVPDYDRPLTPAEETERDNGANTLLGAVTVRRSGLTYVIDVIAKSPDAQRAADIANTFVNEYVGEQMRSKIATTRNAREWLDERMVQLRSEAAAADAELQQFTISNGLMSANGATMAEEEASALNQQIAGARADLAEKRGRLSAAMAQVRRGGAGADVAQALDSTTITSLRQREADASRRLAELNARYGNLHPDVRNAEKELADARDQIQSEINRILSRMRAEVSVAESRLASLQSSQSAAQQALAANSRAQVGYLELQRKADAAREIYEAFLSRSKETAAQEGLQQADARVSANSPVPSTPDYPNYTLALIFAPLAALASGVGSVLLAEYFQSGIRTKSQVERKLRLRYAGAVPDLESTLGDMRNSEGPHDYILTHPRSTFIEAFRSLRAFVQLRRRGSKLAVAITSALPMEGKTTTSVCFARTAAMDGTRTILVDCDLRRRGTSAIFDIEKDGLRSFIAGEATLEEAVFVDEPTGLAVLGTAEGNTDTFDPLTAEKLEELIATLKREYDLVVIDTAPVLGVADARTVAAGADSVLVVVRWGKTSPSAAEAAVEILDEAGVPMAGAALTQVDIRKYASTGNEDVYGYHKRFAGYYQN